MTAVEETTDAMTASFAASTFDAEVNDPWGTTTARGLSPHDVSNILCMSFVFVPKDLFFL